MVEALNLLSYLPTTGNSIFTNLFPEEILSLKEWKIYD